MLFVVFNTMKIKEMSADLRPREKAIHYGLSSLSDLEILCLLLQSGNRERSVFDLAAEVLDLSENLNRLFDLRLEELMEIKGIKQVKALQILTGIELCRRALQRKNYQAPIVQPEDLVKWFQLEIGPCFQEHFVSVYLNAKGKIIHHKLLFIGTLTESCAHPREIYHDAYLCHAHALIMIHNHPSGDPTPSPQDIEFTRCVDEVGKMTGIPLLDHIIVGKSSWFSFKQHQYLD